MKKTSETYTRVTDEAGEAYFCPMDTQSETVSVAEPEACVEASTVERYSGNINVSK